MQCIVLVKPERTPQVSYLPVWCTWRCCCEICCEDSKDIQHQGSLYLESCGPLTSRGYSLWTVSKPWLTQLFYWQHEIVCVPLGTRTSFKCVCCRESLLGCPKIAEVRDFQSIEIAWSYLVSQSNMFKQYYLSKYNRVLMYHFVSFRENSMDKVLMYHFVPFRENSMSSDIISCPLGGVAS